ncbi:MAG: hypothetical protein HY225_00190 [Candidatus Vogelbacteria bacterium]|nr:hypothetical protein [Candidatus Vogelbacteria bacterium]
MNIKRFFMEFNDRFMHPDNTMSKYEGRDPKVSKTETERRRASLPLVERASKYWCMKNDIEPPEILIKGSCSIGVCTHESDLDLAIVVEPKHPLATEGNLWTEYKENIENSVKTGFNIEARLITDRRNKLQP